MRKLLFITALLCLVLLPASAQEPVLTVDASDSWGPISTYVYGSNMNLYTVIPMALMDEAQSLGLGYVRFGGGDSDIQDLRTNIIDLFIYQTRQIGAEPAITVRLLGGTPEKAAELVHYTNIEKDYKVKYWSIGNEPNLFVALMDVETYTTEDLVQQWRAIAEAMLEVDPTIQFVGPDITQYNLLNTDVDNLQYFDRGSSVDAQGNDWIIEFLKANGDLLSYVSIHRYPWPGLARSGATVEGLREQSRAWDGIVDNLREVVIATTGRNIPIAVTEFNSNSANSTGGIASLDSFHNALWLGDVLGRLIRQKAEIIAYWDLQGGSNRGWGLIGSYSVRPTAYTYMMYTHFGTELVAANAADDPNLSIYAALREDGALTLMVINLGDQDETPTLALNGFQGGSAEVWRFDAEHNAEAIDSEVIEDGSNLTVPAYSITVYVIPAQS
jgi:hypothetical protein